MATGYNVQLPGMSHEQIIVNNRDISTVHAEMKCLMFCAKHGISTNNTILITTHSACQICTKLLVQAGIQKIYYIKEYNINENPFVNAIKSEQL